MAGFSLTTWRALHCARPAARVTTKCQEIQAGREVVHAAARRERNDESERVRGQFSEKELSDLTYLVMAINAGNRANVGLRTVPGSADAAYGLDKANLG